MFYSFPKYNCRRSAELHVIEGSTALQFVQAKFSVATSEAERIGVDQVAKILPPGASTSADQREFVVGKKEQKKKKKDTFYGNLVSRFLFFVC
jgi:hypothetical protein